MEERPATEQIDIADVTTTYQGRQGCACGCRGSYATEGRAVTMRVNRVNMAIASGAGVTEYVSTAENCFEYIAPNGMVTRVYVKN